MKTSNTNDQKFNDFDIHNRSHRLIAMAAFSGIMAAVISFLVH